MSKMGSHDPFGHMKRKLWPKEGLGIKLPLKVKNHCDFFLCKWHATYRWKACDKGYNFFLNLILVRGFHTKLWAPKIMEIRNFGNFGTPIWKSWNKMTFGCWSHGQAQSMLYNRKGGGFPQVWAVVSFVNPCLPVVCLCTKMFQLHINQLVV